MHFLQQADDPSFQGGEISALRGREEGGELEADQKGLSPLLRTRLPEDHQVIYQQAGACEVCGIPGHCGWRSRREELE